jgi:hypothetical protein
MTTLIHVNGDDSEILGGICPGCHISLDECSFPSDYSKLIHINEISDHDYDYKSLETPINRGMIWCDTCNGRFIMDPFAIPTKISFEKSKIKYPHYVP